MADFFKRAQPPQLQKKATAPTKVKETISVATLPDAELEPLLVAVEAELKRRGMTRSAAPSAEDQVKMEAEEEGRKKAQPADAIYGATVEAADALDLAEKNFRAVRDAKPKASAGEYFSALSALEEASVRAREASAAFIESLDKKDK